MVAFSEEVIKKLNYNYEESFENSYELFKKYTSKSFTNEKAEEFANIGFGSRLRMLARCVHNVYKICPLERIEKPTNEELYDLTINLQSFIFNAYGCLDNLAWIWVKEKEIKSSKGRELPNSKIGLLGKYKNGNDKGEYKFKEVRESFSPEFLEYLKTMDDWFEDLENFRHALAHRIPPYVIPYILNKKDKKKQMELIDSYMNSIINNDSDKCKKIKNEIKSIGIFAPYLTHSYSEKSHKIIFHGQIIIDLKTIIEIAEKLLNELESPQD